MQPDWFQLGDRDLATHLVRSQMLRAGYPLSEVTAALCDRWQPGARLLPVSDDRCETHAVITDPADDSQRAIHFQEWWVRYRAQVPTHSFAFIGSEKANATTEVTDAIADADVILVAPSNPVVSVGRAAGHSRCPRSTAIHWRARRRLLTDHRRKTIARDGR